MFTYQQAFDLAASSPETFWKQQAEQLDWFTFPQTILSQDEHGIERWFADGELNTAHLALDYHVEQGRGDQTALIYDSPVTGKKARYTYRVLRDQVAKVAGMLASLGVQKGDRVVIYMPMIPRPPWPCWPVLAWGPFTPWCSAVLRPTSWRCALRMPSQKCCSPPAAGWK